VAYAIAAGTGSRDLVGGFGNVDLRAVAWIALRVGTTVRVVLLFSVITPGPCRDPSDGESQSRDGYRVGRVGDTGPLKHSDLGRVRGRGVRSVFED
jgi:hypothetical protein